MRIAIIGRHPTLEPGFNSTMSVTEALGFEAAGCDVTLLLPKSPAHDPGALLAAKRLRSMDDLCRYGGSFDVKVMEQAGDATSHDVILWQSYRPEEHSILTSLRGCSAIRTKSAPRLFTGTKAHDERKALGMLRDFDLVATSLQADATIVEDIMPNLADRFRYVPRGFHLDLLRGETRDAVPTIGLDRAVKAADDGRTASSHIIRLGLALQDLGRDTRFLSLRAKINELNSTRIPVLPFTDFYSQFIGRLWLYMPIDFEYSVHRAGRQLDRAGRKVYVGLYENQIVETQVAGGLILARRDDIAEELIALPAESFVDDYEDIASLVARALEHIDDFPRRSRKTREWARQRHGHVAMAENWLGHLRNLSH